MMPRVSNDSWNGTDDSVRRKEERCPMSFLLDTDICSAYLRNDAVVVRRVMLHYGGLNVSVITVGELQRGGTNAPAARLKGVQDILKGARSRTSIRE